MLIQRFTSKNEASGLLFHKPVSQIVVREIFSPDDKRVQYPQKNVPYARVRLVDGSGGSSSEVVPKTLLTHLSELSSKYEGFDVRCGSITDLSTGERLLSGEGIYTILLGGISESGRHACVDLSNQKYFDLELSGLHPDATYEIYGIEGYEVSSFVRRYSQLFLSRDELQKNIKIGDNELLVLPLNGLEEIQFYPKNGRSFTMTDFELVHDAMRNNDISLVHLTKGIEFNIDNSLNGVKRDKFSLLSHLVEGSSLKGTSFKGEGILSDISLGSEDLTVIDVTEIDSIDIRRSVDTSHVPYTFYMIDTKLSGN